MKNLIQEAKKRLRQTRSGMSKGLMAFIAFTGSVFLGGFLGNAVASLFGLESLLGSLTGIVIVLPITFVLYRYISKRFVHQQIG